MWVRWKGTKEKTTTKNCIIVDFPLKFYFTYIIFTDKLLPTKCVLKGKTEEKIFFFVAITFFNRGLLIYLW